MNKINTSTPLDTLRLCYGNVSDTLGMLVRTALVSSPGNVFIDCDFSAIEARVIAWLAGEQWVLDVFNSHGKIYEATYAQMYGIPVEEVTKKQRQQGKVANLALGFQGGVNALTRMDFGNALTEAEKPVLVKKWREANPNIVKLWYNLQDAAIKAVLTGQPQKVGYITYRHEVSGNQSFLTGELPSGRKLFYVRPRVVEGKWGKPALRFWGKDDKGNWSEQDTYGGHLSENVTQAVARDILAENITRLAQTGYAVAFSVHDEVVIDCPRDRASLEHTYEEKGVIKLKQSHPVAQIMGTPIPWAPGLPLKAEGWLGNFYSKD